MTIKKFCISAINNHAALLGFIFSIISCVLLALFLGCDVENQTQEVVEIKKPKTPEMGVIDEADILPYTEKELRDLINNKNVSKDVPERRIYWARFHYQSAIKFNKGVWESSNHWANMSRKYKNVIGKDKFWACMMLADSDFNQIHGK